MKEVVGQYTFLVTPPAEAGGVLFVIPKDSGGDDRPDMVLLWSGLCIPHPAMANNPILRQQAIVKALRDMEIKE